jgi:hypothetical protein
MQKIAAKNPHLVELMSAMTTLTDAYITLAGTDGKLLKKNSSSSSSEKNGGSVLLRLSDVKVGHTNLEKEMSKVCRVEVRSGRRTIENTHSNRQRNIAVVTASVPVEADSSSTCKSQMYSTIPFMDTMDAVFTLANSGLSVPKVLNCRGTNGKVRLFAQLDTRAFVCPYSCFLFQQRFISN